MLHPSRRITRAVTGIMVRAGDSAHKPTPVRKKEILDAAKGLFMSRGYDGASVNDILDATKLSKGAFYHHFSSKGDVMQALFVPILGRIIAEGNRAGEIAIDEPTETARVILHLGQLSNDAFSAGMPVCSFVIPKEEGFLSLLLSKPLARARYVRMQLTPIFTALIVMDAILSVGHKMSDHTICALGGPMAAQ